MADEWKDLEGAVLAGFRLERYLAHGGQAAVFVGVNEARRGLRRAIKVVAPHLARDEAFKQRFLEEAEALERLSHKNIVGYRDTRIAPVMRGRETLRDGQPFLALEMELLEGRTLGEVEEAGGRPPVEDVLDWCAQVCDGLSAAHAQGVVHRDIKPGNVFVCDDGIVKVIDFGIAQAISRADADSGGRLTKTGHTAGTMMYIAPELWSGKEATAQADLYALGLTMAQVLLGRHPFVGVNGRFPNDVEIMHGHVQDDLRAKLVQPRLSKLVEELIVKLCRRDPALRPADAAAAAAEIRDVRQWVLSFRQPDTGGVTMPEGVKSLTPIALTPPESVPGTKRAVGASTTPPTVSTRRLLDGMVPAGRDKVLIAVCLLLGTTLLVALATYTIHERGEGDQRVASMHETSADAGTRSLATIPVDSAIEAVPALTASVDVPSVDGAFASALATTTPPDPLSACLGEWAGTVGGQYYRVTINALEGDCGRDTQFGTIRSCTRGSAQDGSPQLRGRMGCCRVSFWECGSERTRFYDSDSAYGGTLRRQGGPNPPPP